VTESAILHACNNVSMHLPSSSSYYRRTEHSNHKGSILTAIISKFTFLVTAAEAATSYLQ
jgi:hypothetical protein